MRKNTLKEIRESQMMSKAELARKAGISPITITRIENGMPCRMETQRKIVLALGYRISDKSQVELAHTSFLRILLTILQRFHFLLLEDQMEFFLVLQACK